MDRRPANQHHPAHLPADCEKVVWVDTDLLFGDPDWVGRVADLLQEYIVVHRSGVAPRQTRSVSRPLCW